MKPFKTATIKALTVLATLLLGLSPRSEAQFSPGPNPVTGAETSPRTLSSGTGTVDAGGSITLSGNTVAVVISGTSNLVNNGTIQQTGSGRAINNSANNSVLTITNNAGGTISSVSSDAIRIATANSSIALTNSGSITVSAGGQALDFAAITTAANSINNQVGGLISAVGEDAVRPGTNGSIINAGTIQSSGNGDGVDIRTKTGIEVTNAVSGVIKGRHGIATDGAATASTITVNNSGSIEALNGSGLNIDGANSVATVNNLLGAVIKGGVLSSATDGDGDGVDVDGSVVLTNAGDILGLGAKGLGSDSSPNNAEAISIGGGTVINTVTGQIIGSTLATDAPNGDFTRAGNGILVDNSSGGNAHAAASVENSGLIQGKTGFGIKIVGTFDDSITNNASGAIRGAGGTGSGAAVQTGGGNDTITNAGIITRDSGGTDVAIDAGDGNDTITISGGSAAVNGHMDGGTGTGDVLNLNIGTGGTFTYSGTLTNVETVNINSGTTTLTGAGSLGTANIVFGGGTLDISGISGSTYTLASTQALTGSATLNATGKTLVAGGILAPDNSPSTITVTGNFSLAATTVSNFEINGTTTGLYDFVDVNGIFTQDGTLHLTTGYSALLGDTVQLFDATSFQGSFDTITGTALGGGLSWDITNLATTGSITVIPEPSSLALILLSLGAVRFFRRRKSTAETNLCL